MANSEAITRQVFEGTVGWMPWLRPGYELGQQLAAEGNRILVSNSVKISSVVIRMARSATEPPPDIH